MVVLAIIGKVVIGLLGLGIMIFVHELGHLLAAKFLKVKVETFSLGYGKKLIGFKKGDTTYQIAIFPFGGFTKFKGEHVFAKTIEQNLDRFPDDADIYYNQAPWKRILISLAGPLANVLFALLFFTAIYWVGFNEYTYDNRISLYSDYNYLDPTAAFNPANEAGLKSGDRIVKINGAETRNYQSIARIINMSPNQPLTMQVVGADGNTRNVGITPRLETEQAQGVIGIMWYTEPIIMKIDDPTAANNPWLKPGDRIVSLGGQETKSNLDIIHAFQAKPASLPAVVERAGKTVSGTWTMRYNDKGFPLIGLVFAAKVFRTPAYTLPQAFVRGLSETGYTMYSIINLISLIPQKINLGNAIGGPVMTTYFIGEYATEGLDRGLDQGIVQFIQFLCFLSAILAFMNLLPFPVLDGGFVVLFLIEWIRRKPFRPRFLYYFQMVGVIVLFILGAFVIVNDFFHIGRF